MIKKTLQLISLILLLLILLKGLFFSGTAGRTAFPTAFKKHPRPGLVWAAAGSHYQRSSLGNFFLGRHYRAVWSVMVAAPVLNLDKTLGGLRVGKIGGGMQTTSLSLTDSLGKTWVLRSLDKNPAGVLSRFWQHSWAADLVQDQISAANPYAALVVARLSQHAGIPHTNPRVVFVAPNHPAIRKLPGNLPNHLFLLEEKHSTPRDQDQSLPVYNSVEMLDLRYRIQGQEIDQQLFARCRLFDILIGDWDRHEGQWNWQAFPTGQGQKFLPFPKDRDQAFSQYHDGLVPWLLTRDFALRKFGNFEAGLDDITPYTINGRFLDERLLNALSRRDFELLAADLQRTMPDAVIEDAVRHFPGPVYALVGPATAATLKARRNHLIEAARNYYRILARRVMVAGTDQREQFVVERLNDNQTRVRVFQLLEHHQTGKLLYQRTFLTKETKSVTLHGLAGDDLFLVSGKVKKGIMVSLVGGPGADVMRDASFVDKGEKKTLVLDTRHGTEIKAGKETVNKTTDDLSVHIFDREGY